MSRGIVKWISLLSLYSGPVKKAGAALKIVHDKYKSDIDAKEDAIAQLEEATKHNKELLAVAHRVDDALDPIKVLKLLKNMLPEVGQGS